jgi:hypothetical protein
VHHAALDEKEMEEVHEECRFCFGSSGMTQAFGWTILEEAAPPVDSFSLIIT